MALAKSLIVFNLLGTAGFAALLPETWAGAARGSLDKVPLGERKIWDEYGFAEAERAVYRPEKKGDPFTATVIRFQDSTGAMAAFQWQAGPDATYPAGEKLIAEIPPDRLLRAEGNYLIRVEGKKPTDAEIHALVVALPRYESSPLPVLPGYLPADGMVAGSRRYVLGPESLAAFEGRIAPSLAGFHLGAEGQVAEFQTVDGPMKMAIFSYPTPAIARERHAEFRKLGGSVAKRTGSLVVAALGAPSPDAAERLLARVRFQGSISWSEYIPTQRDNIGDLIVNIFILIGFLLVFSLVAGMAVGGFRALRFVRGVEPEGMITLHLRDR